MPSNKVISHTPEWNWKISLAHKGIKPLEETRRRMSLAHLGKPSGMKGKKHSEESKRKMSLSSKGQVVWNKGKKGIYSEETKKRIGLASKGRIPWNKSKKLHYKVASAFKKEHTPWNRDKIGIYSKEQIEKLRQRRLKQIIPFKDTSIEIGVQNLLKENNIKFETHYPILGQPDIFIKPNICIFVDGCYWHKCSQCGFKESIRKEREKDIRINEELQKQGYTVIRIWEHEIKNNQFSGLNQLLN